MQEKQTTIRMKLGTNIIHHHFGVLPSATPAMWSESQPKGRWFRTNGCRSSSAGVCGIIGTDLTSCSAISAPLPSAGDCWYGRHRDVPGKDSPAYRHTP